MNAEHVGNQIMMRRRQRRLSQKVVACAVGMNYRDLSKIERGQRPRVPLETVIRIADFLGCTVNDFYLERKGP